MTDFSDQVQAAFDRITKTQSEEHGLGLTIVTSQEDVDDSSLSNTFMHFDHVWAPKFFALMRRKYRWQAGSAQPESYPLMHEKLKDLLLPATVPFFKQCLAAGVQIGQEDTYLVRRAVKLNRYHELFDKETFIHECALLAMQWDGEGEVNELLERYYEGSAVHLATNAGLPNSPNPEHIARAWDVWSVAGRSLTALSYSVGELVGRENRERDLLKNAERQMENTDGAE
jgi:hypothetical protein